MSFQDYIDRRNSFFKKIKTLGDIDYQEIPLIVDYLGYEGFNYEDEAIEWVADNIKDWKNVVYPVKLYRVVGVKNENNINFGDLGTHWTLYDWNIDGFFLESIGFDPIDEELIPYVLVAKCPASEIDVVGTVFQWLSFPREHEVSLFRKGKGVKLIDVYPLYD